MYGLPEANVVPDLLSEAALVEWGKKIIERRTATDCPRWHTHLQSDHCARESALRHLP